MSVLTKEQLSALRDYAPECHGIPPRLDDLLDTIADLQRQAQVREIEIRLDEAKWWKCRTKTVWHTEDCPCDECKHITALSPASERGRG